MKAKAKAEAKKEIKEKINKKKQEAADETSVAQLVKKATKDYPAEDDAFESMAQKTKVKET